MLAPSPAAACDLPSAEPALILEVPDARTLKAADGRLFHVTGIESFSALDGSPEADSALKESLARRAAGQWVHLHPTVTKPDRHGRYPALILSADGNLLQAELAGEGAAIAYPGHAEIPCFDEILAAEAAARRIGAGAWRGRTDLPSARPDALADQIDRYTIVEGRILSVGNREWRTYLNFGRRWSEDFTVTIEAKDRERFGGEEGLAALTGALIRVRGHMTESGGPLIVLRSPQQLELLDQNSARTDDAP